MSAMDYGKDDVIIWADDSRLDDNRPMVWGAPTPTACLRKANGDSNGHFAGVLLSAEEDDEPFLVWNDRDDKPSRYACVIVMKDGGGR